MRLVERFVLAGIAAFRGLAGLGGTMFLGMRCSRRSGCTSDGLALGG